MAINTRFVSAFGAIRHRYVGILLGTAASMLLAMTWLHVHMLVDESRERTITGAEQDLANTTRLTQEHAVRTLRGADQVMRFVQNRYVELGERLDLAAMTRQGVIDTQIFNQVGVADAQGVVVLSNQPITTPIDISDRAYFKTHAASDTGELLVSPPFIGRITGKWSINITRRINKPNGDFGGVVVIAMDPTYFTNFYGELNLGPGGVNGLYGLDGMARARRLDDTTDFVSDASASVLFQQKIKEAPNGIYQQKSAADGLDRLIYYRTVPDYPLLTMAGLDMRYVLADHHADAQALYRQGALVSLLIVALAALMASYALLLRHENKAKQLARVQIEDRESQLTEVCDLSHNGVVLFDVDRCVKFSNPAFKKMTGSGALSLKGMRERDFSAWLASLCTPAAPFEGIARLHTRALANGDEAHQTIELNHGDYRVVQAQLRVSHSVNVSHILYLRDITHETEVESLKSEFLATAAHELRTPMASIYGFSEILLTHASKPADQQEFVGIIHKQSKLMINILNELLDLARIEARRGKDFKFTSVCLQDLLNDLFQGFHCPEGRATPTLVAPSEPIHLLADTGKLRQALLNVLANAYKYSPGGGPVVVRLTLQGEKDPTPEVRIEVEDHGMGMTSEQVAKVFTRFYRADPSGKVPGTGLGMSITKEIISYHQGNIFIVSAPGQGTQISVVLPVQA